MKNNKIIWGIVVLAVLVTIVFSLGNIVTINSQTQTTQQQSKSANKEINEAMPIVDFADANLNIDQSRINKNAKYDNSGFVVSEPPPDAGEAIRFPGENSVLSDMPVETSDLIIEGQVNDSKAFLSNDKTGVYSEFTVAVSIVLKNNEANSIKEGETITAERFGGRFRYPSDKIMPYKMSGQGLPSANAKYLFFLAKTVENNYRILTAYELKNGKVSALDGARNYPRGGKEVFDSHNEKDYESFVNEIKKKIEKRKETNKNEKPQS